MSSPLFLYEAFHLLSFTTIPGMLLGISISIYIVCAQHFYYQCYKAPPGERGKIVFSFFYNTLMVFMAALELGTQSRLIQLIFINHGGVHGEPQDFESVLGRFSALWLSATLPSFVIGILSPLMQIWRTWIIWATSPYKLVVLILPVIIVIAGLALNISANIFALTPNSLQKQNMSETALAALNVSFNVLVTLLLVGRIMVVRRRHIRLMGTPSEYASQYSSIIAVLTESYALDAIWSTAQMISYAITIEGNLVPVWEIFNSASDQITVIAFLLVTYRVILKRAWTPETERKLSTIRWNRDAAESDDDGRV